MKRASRPDTTPATRPCCWCGVAAPVPMDPRGDSYDAAEWRACPACQEVAGIDGHAAAMLTAVGIAATPADVAVAEVLARTPWRAEFNRETSEDLPFRPGQIATTAPVGTGNRLPWRHVDAPALRRAVETAQAAAARPPVMVKCTDGPCAGCGVNVAAKIGPASPWSDFGVTTPSGRRLVLCADCAAAWERSGQSFHDGVWEDELAALAIRVQPVMHLAADYDFHTYDTQTDAATAGYDQPFGYVPPQVIEAARADFWRRFPTKAPAEVRERMERAAAARRRLDAMLPPPPPGPPMRVPGADLDNEAAR